MQPPSIPDRKSAVSGFALERTAKRMKQYFQQVLAEADTGVTVDQWVILQQLERHDGRSQHELAVATFKDPPTVTRIIDLLCAKGLTRRVSDPDDRRRYRIHLTTRGRRRIGEILPLVRDFRRQAWRGLADDTVDQLVDTLDRIFDNLNGERPLAG